MHQTLDGTTALITLKPKWVWQCESPEAQMESSALAMII